MRKTLIRMAAIAISPGIVPVILLAPAQQPAQNTQVLTGPPPSSGGFFPLSEVHRGLKATAWTVFEGSKPEPMEVEILGVLRGARGPGQDMILAQLHGAKPEYTGVVAGMSGSPVYVGSRLLGSLSYRIGQFSKDPIAGITPIQQMLEVRDLPIGSAPASFARQSSALNGSFSADTGDSQVASGMNLQAPIQAMETPLTMSGFHPEAIRLWKQKMAGTGLEMVMAGGMSGSSQPGSGTDSVRAAARPTLEPGSAVSALLVRGDLEIAATCTVTYIDPRQLLACGHPLLQAGPVSLPMTATEVVATLASPLNAFKIVNTGATIGAFTQDRDSAIRGVLGARARMIPVHIVVHGPGTDRKVNIEILDLPSLTPQAMLVSLYNALLQSNENTAETSYHLTGSIDLEGEPPSPLDFWASAGDTMTAPLLAAQLVGERFGRLYSNETRLGSVRGIELHVEVIPRRVQVDLEAVRLISGSAVHAGDTVVVEATIRPWQQPSRNVRISVPLPSRLRPGNLRLLVSDSGTLDRTLEQPLPANHTSGLEAELAQARSQHPADRIYVSLLAPEAQAGIEGQTLTSLPLSVANTLEPMRSAQDVSLNGESAEVVGEAPAGGVLKGFQILNLRMESGGGLN